MNIGITRQQARNVKFYDHPEFVRACFYLGIGMMEISEIIDTPFSGTMMNSIIQSAYDMGMDDSDVVYIRR